MQLLPDAFQICFHQLNGILHLASERLLQRCFHFGLEIVLPMLLADDELEGFEEGKFLGENFWMTRSQLHAGCWLSRFRKSRRKFTRSSSITKVSIKVCSTSELKSTSLEYTTTKEPNSRGCR